jgi:hypothetical protein
LKEAPTQFEAQPARTVRERIQVVVSWLENEWGSGFLQRTYITATIVVAVSDDEVWTWLGSPHGAAHVHGGAASFVSTDLRYPVLRQMGLMRPPAYRFPGTDATDNASSIVCIGTPKGYECIRTRLSEGDLLLAFDRATLPFGPWPTEAISMEQLWSMDAGRRHGLIGRFIAVGSVAPDALQLPAGWRVIEIPLHQ